MLTEKAGGMLFFDSVRGRLVIGGKYYHVSNNAFTVAKQLFPAGTFVILCICDGVVRSIETDTDIESAVCVCVKEGEYV